MALSQSAVLKQRSRPHALRAPVRIFEATRADHAALLRGEAPRHFGLAKSPIASMDVLDMLAELAEEVSEDFFPASWLIVEGADVVGLCSIKWPPDHGFFEIGYGISPCRHNRGIASRAIAQVIGWARRQPYLRAITAETLPENLASQRVLTRNGFVAIGERLDEEDGIVICWRRRLT